MKKLLFTFSLALALLESSCAITAFGQTATRGGGNQADWVSFLSPLSGATWNGNTITVPYGGTGVATLASNGILYGNGASAIQALAVNSSGTNKFLSQVSSGTPAWGTLVSGDIPNLAASIITSGTFAEARGGTNQSTYATGDILYASASNTLSKLTIGSTGQTLTVAGGVPVWSSNAPFTWTILTADGTLSVNTATINNKASTQGVFTLPSTAAAGSELWIANETTFGAKIAQNASGKMHLGAYTTTTGTGGYITLDEQYSTVHLVCSVANNEWIVLSTSGKVSYN